MAALVASRRQQQVVLGLHVVLLTMLAGYAVRVLPAVSRLVPETFDAWYQNLLYALATLLVVLRAAWVRSDKAAWTLLGLGFASYTIGNVLYFTTPSSRLIALDAETGKELWKYDPQANVSRRRTAPWRWLWPRT